MDNSKLGNYLLYLNVIQKKIDKFFDDQKEYIFCHEGCAKCCKKAQFPYSEIEFRLLLEGMFSLDKDLQMQIMERIEKVIQAKKEHFKKTPDEKFRYDCPFIVDDRCSVYKFRGLICRYFGLMDFKPGVEHSSQIPFCAYEGLNYSNVIDFEKRVISTEKFKEQGFKNEPKAFNTGYLALTDEVFAEKFDFEFGETKPLIDWFEYFGEAKNKN